MSLATLALLAAAAWGARAVVASLAPAMTPPKSAVSATTTVLRAGRSVAYLVRAPRGPILVDTGSAPSGQELLAGLAAQGLTPDDVTNVLLTSAHPDHAAAVPRLPRAVVWVGEHDGPTFARERHPRAPLALLLARMTPATGRVRPRLVRAGELLDVAGAAFTVVALPCVTSGSVAYVHDGVAFLGSALGLEGDALTPSSALMVESPKRCLELLPRLQQWNVATLATGRGVLNDATAALRRLNAGGAELQ